jgi:hypothetical protein
MIETRCSFIGHADSQKVADMSPKLFEKLLRLALVPLCAAVLVTAGCSSSSMTTTGTQSAETGSAFAIGTDAPMASVVSFPVQLESVELTGSGGSTTTLISGMPTVDFARYNGLQALLDMNDVPVGTYTGVTITLGSGSIGYLDTSSTPPAIQSMAASFTSSTVNVTLTKPLVVVHGGNPVGLRLDFDLAQSIEVDSNGNITGTVNPTFDATAVKNSDRGGYIDEFIAGVVSVNQAGQSFVVQGPHGANFTINVSGSTEWDGDASLSTLNTSSIVAVSGKIDPADRTLDADVVALISDKGFYATGQITYVAETAGNPATSFDLYVRGLEPTSTGLALGQLATVDLTGNEKYYIYWAHNPLTQFLFNSSSLLAGQDIAMGGPATGAANASDVTVDRIHLRNWGFNGTIVAGSQNPADGTFQMQIKGFAGVLIPETVTVYLGPICDFRYGLDTFTDLTDGASIRVVGLLLNDPANGQVVLVARHIDGTDFTDFTATAAAQ